MDYLQARDGMVVHNVHPSIIAAFDVLANYSVPQLVLDQPGGNLAGETNTIGEPSDKVSATEYRNAAGVFVLASQQDADGKAETVTHRKRSKKVRAQVRPQLRDRSGAGQ